MSNKIIKAHGDATDPDGDGKIVIPHVCNDIGKWGKGFVKALSSKWPETRKFYMKWYRDGVAQNRKFKLGHTTFLQVEETDEKEIVVANMIAQHKIAEMGDTKKPIRYAALVRCMAEVAIYCQKEDASIHAPVFGCGLAGGAKEVVFSMINELWISRGISVTVYNY